MKIALDQEVARHYDSWYETDAGRYISSLEEGLIKQLLWETKGLHILEMGYGTGRHLKLLKSLGSDTVGVEPSVFILRKAKEKGEIKLILAKGEQLPLRDRAFDGTIVITTLEFCQEPGKMLHEAARVTREKISVGILDKWSFLALVRKIEGCLKPSIYNQADLLSIWKLKRLLKKNLAVESTKWQGVHFLPYCKVGLLEWLDRKLSFRKNPFSSFLGVSVTLQPRP
ncbi:MAG: methyltransferase domain-containing protein [candidate division Zixibacteria bacterium]|nr:methyltransferase domain-containing protein [candidate division Zixibacteria bacterium]